MSWSRAVGASWLDDFRRDLKHGTRLLRRTPGFTATIVLMLAMALWRETERRGLNRRRHSGAGCRRGAGGVGAGLARNPRRSSRRPSRQLRWRSVTGAPRYAPTAARAGARSADSAR